MHVLFDTDTKAILCERRVILVPFSVFKEQLMHGLQLVHSKLCKNVTGSTGLHCTSSRSDHTHLNIHKYFSDDKRGGSDLT